MPPDEVKPSRAAKPVTSKADPKRAAAKKSAKRGSSRSGVLPKSLLAMTPEALLKSFSLFLKQLCLAQRYGCIAIALALMVIFAGALPGNASERMLLDIGNFRSDYQGGFSNAERVETPLYTPECSTPRQTLENFFAIARKIKKVFEDAAAKGGVNWSMEQKLIEFYAQLTYLIDTSPLVAEYRFSSAHVAASQLSEILDRLSIPPLSEIPGEKDLQNKNLEYWRLPHHAEISLARIKKGPRKGDWVFSADSVASADQFYDRVKHLPYRHDANVGRIDKSGGLLDKYISYTGPLVPDGLIDNLPSWLKKKLLWDPVWKYLATLLVILMLLAVALLIYRLTRFKSDTKASEPGISISLRRLILPLSLALLITFAIRFISLDLRLRLLPVELADGVLWGAFCIIAFWLCICLGNLIAALFVGLPAIRPSSLDASLVRLCLRIIAYVVGFWIVLEGVQRIGLSLVPLLAGVGFSGLAFALAARPTLGNLMAGVILFADKPFSVGERVKIGKHNGTIEAVGLRSTRIRTLDGHLVTIPNEEVCNHDVTNIGRRPYIRRKLNITVTYDTPPDKIGRAMEIVGQLLSIDEDQGKSEEELGRPSNSHINTDTFPPKIFFNKLNSDSLNILVLYWFHPPVYWDYLAHTSWVNTQLIERFNREGIDFAFPTQTIELETSSTGPNNACQPIDTDSIPKK